MNEPKKKRKYTGCGKKYRSIYGEDGRMLRDSSENSKSRASSLAYKDDIDGA